MAKASEIKVSDLIKEGPSRSNPELGVTAKASIDLQILIGLAGVVLRRGMTKADVMQALGGDLTLKELSDKGAESNRLNTSSLVDKIIEELEKT